MALVALVALVELVALVALVAFGSMNIEALKLPHEKIPTSHGLWPRDFQRADPLTTYPQLTTPPVFFSPPPLQEVIGGAGLEFLQTIPMELYVL